MTQTAVVLVTNTQLPAAYAAQYTVPANTVVTISAFNLNNTTAGALTASVSIVPAGGSQGAANEVITEIPIAAKTSVAVPLIGQNLPAGTTLQMKGSAATSITAQISGYARTVSS